MDMIQNLVKAGDRDETGDVETWMKQRQRNENRKGQKRRILQFTISRDIETDRHSREKERRSAKIQRQG